MSLPDEDVAVVDEFVRTAEMLGTSGEAARKRWSRQRTDPA